MNSIIINNFNELIKQIKLDIDNNSDNSNNSDKKQKNLFRLKSIESALKIIIAYPNKITSSKQLQNIKLIGKGTLRRIDEILKTGKLSEVKITEIDNKYLAISEKLENIYGIGKKKSYELIKNHNITSINELKSAISNKTIVLPKYILKGIEYYDKIDTNIPRNEIDYVNEYIKNLLNKIDHHLLGVICGSYRRQKQVSGDVDLIIIHPKYKTDINKTSKINMLEKIILEMKKQHFIICSLTSDNVLTKYMGLYQLKNKPVRRIDIRFIPYNSYYTALLYFTGSKDFNKMLRLKAKNLGYILNEYGLYKNGKAMNIKSEKDVFDILDISYMEPGSR